MTTKRNIFKTWNDVQALRNYAKKLHKMGYSEKNHTQYILAKTIQMRLTIALRLHEV